MDTDNIVLPLLLAAISLKQSAQTNFLSAAGDNLMSAGELLAKMREGDKK